MSQTTTIDPRELRNALGNFATGVTIVTTVDSDKKTSDALELQNNDPQVSGGYVGTTASSFNSVSLDPPLILWSIDKNARSLPIYKQAKYFAVNVLSADQVSLSNHFARQQEDKFDGVDFELGRGGVPLFKGCAARFQCRTQSVHEGGDHLIIVGEVLDFDTTGRDALLFHRGKYVVSEYHPCNAVTVQGSDTETSHFTDDHLHYLVGRSFSQLMKKLNGILPRQDMNEWEYRILASLSGRNGCELSVLCEYAVLDSAEVVVVLESLENRGLVLVEKDGQVSSCRIFLTEVGSERLAPLLAAAKSNEVDALGIFNAQEASTLKEFLRRIIEWTAPLDYQ